MRSPQKDSKISSANNTDSLFNNELRMASVNSGNNDIEKNAPKLLEQIIKDFGSWERFKKEFSETAKSVEGSGWALLAWHKEHGNLNIIQIVLIIVI